MPPRIDIVDALTHAALDGMKNLQEEYTSDELLSACFTLTRRTISVILEMKPAARPMIQQAVETLLMDCADVEKQSN